MKKKSKILLLIIVSVLLLAVINNTVTTNFFSGDNGPSQSSRSGKNDSQDQLLSDRKLSDRKTSDSPEEMSNLDKKRIDLLRSLKKKNIKEQLKLMIEKDDEVSKASIAYILTQDPYFLEILKTNATSPFDFLALTALLPAGEKESWVQKFRSEDPENALGFLLEADLPEKTDDEIIGLIKQASYSKNFDGYSDEFNKNMISTLRNLGYNNTDAHIISKSEMSFSDFPVITLANLMQSSGVGSSDEKHLPERVSDYLEISYLMQKSHGDKSITYSAIGTLIEKQALEMIPGDYQYDEEGQTVAERLETLTASDIEHAVQLMAVKSFLESASPEQLDGYFEEMALQGEVAAAKWIDSE